MKTGYIYGFYGVSLALLVYSALSKNSIFLLVAFSVAFITFLIHVDSKVNDIKKEVDEIILKFKIKDDEQNKKNEIK